MVFLWCGGGSASQWFLNSLLLNNLSVSPKPKAVNLKSRATPSAQVLLQGAFLWGSLSTIMLLSIVKI